MTPDEMTAATARLIAAQTRLSSLKSQQDDLRNQVWALSTQISEAQAEADLAMANLLGQASP